jgi:hypothetical protein
MTGGKVARSNLPPCCKNARIMAKTAEDVKMDC